MKQENWDQAYNQLEPMPPNVELETREVLNKAIRANIELARLNGYCSLLPNDSILLSSIVLKEARASSRIENIITTQDALYQALVSKYRVPDQPTKEVLNYRSALYVGFKSVEKTGFMTTNTIIAIQEELENNSAGIRKLSGTSLVNETTGEIIYTPPDNQNTINSLLKNLEMYINTNEGPDTLIKMAVIHYQFESIHPFYDGNGRTGRIINVIFLVLNKLLDSPVLYLSAYINRNRLEYYQLLQAVRTENAWEQWILFILKAVEETSIETLNLIKSIVSLLDQTVELARAKLPTTSYSKELIELLFIHPYTKIEYLVENGIGERRTASKYLKQLEEIGILQSYKAGKEIIYINTRLYELLKRENAG